MISRKKIRGSTVRNQAKGVRSSSLAQTVISTNAEILCLPPSQPTNPERERQLEGSNEAQKALGACRLCAYLCGTPQRLLHDKVEHTRLATKVTDRTCLSRAQCPSRLPSLHILGSTTNRLVGF